MRKTSSSVPMNLVSLMSLACAWNGAHALSLKGRVLEKAMLSPVSGATVSLSGGQSVKTDATGRFQLETSGSSLHGEGLLDGRVDLAAGRIVLSLRAGSIARGEWFAEDGKRISAVTLRPGMAIPAPRISGIAWLRLESGSGRAGYRAALLEGRAVSLQTVGGGPSGSPSTAFAKSLGKSAAYEVSVRMDGLVPRTLTGEAADLGDVVLEYPPRKLDTGAAPPYGAMVLFPREGDSLRVRAAVESVWIHWDTDWRRSQKLPVSPVTWKILNDPLATGAFVPTFSPCCMPRNGSPQWGYDDIVTRKPFRDIQIHAEFNMMGTPDGNASSTGYANSGVYIGDRWELQIETPQDPAKAKTSHDMASLLDFKMPDTFPWRGAGKWQAYDITFRYPRSGESGRVTVYWNGEKVHDNVAWGSGGGERGPLRLQNEKGSDVRYRNVWIKELDIKDAKTDFGY